MGAYLVVMYCSILMVRLVTRWTAQDPTRNNIVQHPRHVVARVRLRQQVRDDYIVGSAARRVQSKQLQCKNIGPDLQSTIR